MATLTHCKVFDANDKPCEGHPFGNNIAFKCTECGHPVLATARRGWAGNDKDNLTECRGTCNGEPCGEKYFIDVVSKHKLRIHKFKKMKPPTTTETRADYPYTLEIPTRWSDFDMMMHLNNVQYYRYFECVVLSYLAKIGADLLRDPIIPFAVESNCKFLRPITPAPAIDAALRIARLGNSSVQYEIGLFEKQQATPSALGRFVHVYLERETEKTTAIPAGVREGLGEILVGEIQNAG